MRGHSSSNRGTRSSKNPPWSMTSAGRRDAAEEEGGEGGGHAGGGEEKKLLFLAGCAREMNARRDCCFETGMNCNWTEMEFG